jgi:glyoxalase family protein
MRLSGIHHVTALCSDLGASGAFYAGLLGLRSNPAEPEDGLGPALAFADGESSPGSMLVLTEAPGCAPGRPGSGQVHTVRLRVASLDALDLWRARLEAAGVATRLAGGDDPAICFSDPDGLALALVVDRSGDEPLVARSPDVPPGFELRGIDGVRAFARDPVPTGDLLAGRLEFATAGPSELYVLGSRRTTSFGLDEPPRCLARRGPGTVDHVAWGCERADQPAWRQRVIGMGARVTPIRARGALDSLFFREPAGILFELCAPREPSDRRAEAELRPRPAQALQAA